MIDLILSYWQYAAVVVGAAATALMVFSYVPEIFRKWCYIAIGVITAFMTLNMVWGDVKDHYIQIGYEKAMDEVAVAAARAEEKTREKQKAIKAQSKKVKDEIRKDVKELGDRPVSPIIKRQLERMRADE